MTDAQAAERARAAGFSLESWMTNPPKPAMWHGTPEAMRKLLEAEQERYAGLLAKCAEIAEWHIADRDECGVLAREVYDAIKGKAVIDETKLEIQTAAGYRELLVYPASVRVTPEALIAEVLDEPGHPAFDALVRGWQVNDRLMFRVNGEEVACRADLDKAPRLEPGKTMTRMLRLLRERC